MSGSGGYGGPSHGPGGPSHHHYHGGPGMPPPPRHRYYGGRTYYRSSGGGCASVFAYLIVFFIIIIAMSTNFGGSSSSNNQKLNREKYHGGVDSSQGYYIDNSDASQGKFIDRNNETTLISGFKEFYNKTGVFPFLYIIENTPDKSEYKGYDTYQDMLYETLFDSEGNFLILYIAEEDDYYFAAGYDTGEIIDEVSLDVICDKVNGYWYTGDLAKAFGNGLEDASKNIMAKSNGRVIGLTIVIGVVVIVIISILFKWWKKKKEQENIEQENLEKILDKPLETFGSDINDLASKYDN